MNWKQFLQAAGYTDQEIAKLEAEYGGDKLAKAFAAPMEAKATAERQLAEAQKEREEFEAFYNNDVLPKVEGVYRDAINWRTRATALEDRLKAAKDYGFLSDTGAIPGVPPGTPITAPPAGTSTQPIAVTGNPNPPASTPSTLDPRYVPADVFTQRVTELPGMLMRLAGTFADHQILFGKPLSYEEGQVLLEEAQASRGKRSVTDVWKEKYKVEERRKQIADESRVAHDRQVGEEAVRKYLSEHHMPFASPGRPSLSTHFTPSSSDDARKPWKNAGPRREERKQKLLQAYQQYGPGSPGTGTA